MENHFDNQEKHILLNNKNHTMNPTSSCMSRIIKRTRQLPGIWTICYTTNHQITSDDHYRLMVSVTSRNEKETKNTLQTPQITSY